MKTFSFTLPHTPMIYVCFEDSEKEIILAYWEAANKRFIYLRKVETHEIETFLQSMLPTQTTIDILDQSTGMRDNYIEI